MARARETDFLQNFRFGVSTIEFKSDADPLNPAVENNPGIAGKAGFQSVTLPEISIEATEYREGNYKYTKKFPGPPTISDVTLMRGVVNKDLAFYDWAVSALSGMEYSANIQIEQYGRTDYTVADAAEYSAAPGTAERTFICYNCTPTRCKPSADLDATSGEVSMAEVDFALEYFTVTPK